MLYARPSNCPRKWHTQTPMGLWLIIESPNIGQKTRPYNNQQKKKENLKNCRLCCPSWPLKECEKRYKYLDLARELKKLWNMKVTFMPIVIRAFGTATKGLLKGLEYLEAGCWVETTRQTALLKTARILRRVQETCSHSISSERPSANADVKNSNE